LIIFPKGKTKMYYNDTLERANEYLRLALSSMGQYYIPVNPSNYTVWYEYVSGQNRELKKAIDVLLKTSEQFSPEINLYLYENFIAQKRGVAGEKALVELQRILYLVSEYLAKAGGEISTHGKSFEKYVDQLQQDDLKIEDLHDIIENILSSSKEVLTHSYSLGEHITNSSKEIDTLRSELKAAKERAIIDPLTGIGNRRAFETVLSQQMKTADIAGQSLLIVMIDIDHFKRINDTFGHLVGDQVLKQVASNIKRHIKGKDYVARYGGEEFVAILPDTPMQGAVAISEQLRSFFEGKNWTKKGTGEAIGSFTISIGISLFRAGESPESFIKRADDALYCSKQKGRNRVTCEMKVADQT